MSLRLWSLGQPWNLGWIPYKQSEDLDSNLSPVGLEAQNFPLAGPFGWALCLLYDL